MLKTRKRWISLLLTLAMLVAFCVPMAGVAAASTGLSALTVPTVSDDVDQELGTVAIEVAIPDALEVDDSVVLSLPSGFDFGTVGNTSAADTEINIPGSYAGDKNALAVGDIVYEQLDDNQIKLKVAGTYNAASGSVAVVLVKMRSVDVDEGFEGDIELTAEAPSGSGFPSGDVVVGRVGAGAVTVSTIDTDTGNDNFTVKFRVKESLKGDLAEDDESLKFTLPDGYEWDDLDLDVLDDDDNGKISLDELPGFKVIWGDDNIANAVVSVDGDELIIDVNDETTKATCFEFTADFSVTDESEVEAGDIMADVEGESDATPTEIKVGEYGDYGVTIKADADIPTIFAGKADQTVVDLEIDEGIAGSLIGGRTILLELPSSARWDKDSFKSTYSDGVVLKFAGLQNSDRTAKFVVDTEDDSAAEIAIDDLEVYTEAGVSGDLVVNVKGSAGVKADGDELVIAKVVTPVTATVENIKDVKLGMASQAAGDLVLTENAAGALAEDGDLIIELPDGVEFDGVPTVSVTDGDIDLGSVDVDEEQLTIPVDSDSDKASTIKVTGIKINVFRTIPVGKVNVSIKGDAAIDNITVEEGSSDNGGYWPNSDTAAKVAIANCVSAVTEPNTGTAVFKIGETKYTVNGQEFTMDVAPVAEAGRTYLPARFVANAMGVPDSNIMWDQASKTVTVIRGERFVQMKVGSKQILVNGITLNMDVAPKVVPGRVLIPFRFLAQALGADVVWDAADPNTITLNF